ncbi:hypothetical protein Tco_0581240 [Tanacetum coccineum]
MVGKLSHGMLQRKRMDKSQAAYITLMAQSTFKSSTDKLAWQILELGDMMREDDLSKDISGPESPPELRRSWYVEGHIRFGVISSVLMQRYLRTIRQKYSPCEGPLSLE